MEFGFIWRAFTGHEHGEDVTELGSEHASERPRPIKHKLQHLPTVTDAKIPVIAHVQNTVQQQFQNTVNFKATDQHNNALHSTL